MGQWKRSTLKTPKFRVGFWQDGFFAGFHFGPPDLARSSSPVFCSSFLWEKCPEKSSRKTPAKSSKSYITKIPDTFLQRSRAQKIVRHFRQFLSRAKNFKNVKKCQKQFSTLFDIFCVAPVFRLLFWGRLCENSTDELLQVAHEQETNKQAKHDCSGSDIQVTSGGPECREAVFSAQKSAPQGADVRDHDLRWSWNT